MSDEGPFPKNYRDFLRKRDKVKGFNFEEVPIVSVVPPIVSFVEKLRWWSMDRLKRMKKIRAERDRRIQEIVQVKSPPE